MPAFIAVLVFVNTLRNGFVYDDYVVLTAIEHFSLTDAARHLFQLRGIPYFVSYLVHAGWGRSQVGQHAVSIVLHGICSALAAVCAKRLSGRVAVGLVTGLLFAVHPVHVEAVASMANRKDVLAMICVMCAMLSYCNTHKYHNVVSLALVCTGVAFVKDIAVIGLVGVLPFVDWLALKRRSIAVRVWPLFVASAVLFYSKLVWCISPEGVQHNTEMLCSTYLQVLTRVAYSLFANVRLLVWPSYLSADYAVVEHPGALWSWCGAAVLTGIVGLCIYLRKRQPLWSFALLWVLLMYAPASNVIPLGHFFVADRYLYVPSFGVCLLLGLIFSDIVLGRHACALVRVSGIAALGAVVLLAAGRSTVRVRDWRDAKSLWCSEPMDRGWSSRYCFQKGMCLFGEERYREAIPMFAFTLRFDTNNEYAIVSLARCLEMTAQMEASLGLLRDGASRIPRSFVVHGALGGVLSRAGRCRESTAAYRKAAEIRRTPEALIDLAGGMVACGESNMYEQIELREAIALATEALALPGCNRGLAFYAMARGHASLGEHEAAVAAAKQARASARQTGDVRVVALAQALVRDEETALLSIPTNRSDPAVSPR